MEYYLIRTKKGKMIKFSSLAEIFYNMSSIQLRQCQIWHMLDDEKIGEIYPDIFYQAMRGKR